VCIAEEKQPTAPRIGHEGQDRFGGREDRAVTNVLPCMPEFAETFWPSTTRRPCARGTQPCRHPRGSTLAASAASRRLVAAAAEWDSYCSPQLGEPAEELFDQLGEESAPPIFGEVVADVTAHLPKAARRAH
jgi:hypothetical protein